MTTRAPIRQRLFQGGVLLAFLTSLLFPAPLHAADAVAWYSPDWHYRQKIPVNHELVGGSVDGFPMLVKLTGKVFDYAQSDGDDILFTSSDGTTKLLHEIESMNGEVVAWVQMPNLSEIQDTVLYVYYGNPTAENQQSGTNVWGNGYLGVWHMGEGPSETHVDVTANENDGTPQNMDGEKGVVDGKIGRAADFQQAGDYIAVADDSLAVDYITISSWFNVPAWRGAPILNRRTAGNVGGFTLEQAGVSGRMVQYFYINGGWRNQQTNDWPLNEWVHITTTYDGQYIRTYRNGVEIGTPTAFSGVLNKPANPRVEFARNIATTSVVFEGSLDHSSVSNVARSGAWIKTEYNNQCGCENFLTIAEVETNEASTSAEAAADKTAGKGSTLSLSSPLIQSINQLFRTAYQKEPTFTGWLYWAGRVIAGDKATLPELLGAMQWQSLFGPVKP